MVRGGAGEIRGAGVSRGAGEGRGAGGSGGREEKKLDVVSIEKRQEKCLWARREEGAVASVLMKRTQVVEEAEQAEGRAMPVPFSIDCCPDRQQ